MDELTCHGCRRIYDSEERRPLILPECGEWQGTGGCPGGRLPFAHPSTLTPCALHVRAGHTLCKACAAAPSQRCCAECHLPFGRPVAQLATNLLALQALQAQRTPLDQLMRGCRLDPAATGMFIAPDSVTLLQRLGTGGSGDVWAAKLAGRKVTGSPRSGVWLVVAQHKSLWENVAHIAVVSQAGHLPP